MASLAAIVLLACAPGAAAQEPGVTLDPDSPSAKEYAIPLESARRGAEPGRERGASVEQGERGAPLFGAGISGAAGEVLRSAATPRTRPAASPTPARRRAERAPAVVRMAAANPGAPDGGAGANALVLAGGAVVVGVGAGAGLLARRRFRTSRP
jgi:hypothetical protein